MLHLVLTEIIEGLFEVVKQIPMLFRLHYRITNIIFDISPDLSFQDDLNALLICTSPVLETKCHLCITEDSKWSDKRCFFFVINGKADLMIARIGI
jgi:hypothetical protein